MTQEQKAKAYDEALELAKNVLLDCTPEEQKVVEYIFSKLREGKDDRIRKMIIALVNAHGQGMFKESMLAWLEKQGEKGAKGNEREIPNSEQKPADKVEPKFHVGDMVKRKDNPHLTYILKRLTDDGDYEFHAIGKDGHEGCTCFSVVKYQDKWELIEQNPAWS